MNTVYTIGYEGTDIDRFLATLTTVGVQELVDVRAIPISRKKGFSKSSLSARCIEAGLSYRHVIELGDPKDGREAARSGRLEDFRRIYTAHLERDAATFAFEMLVRSAAQTASCLMCFERDPLTCHRSLVGERLRERGFRMVHLLGDSPSRYLDHVAKLPGRNLGEGAAAA